MSLNDTPSANRIHIGFFGRRNAGKSSLVNAVTAQDLAVVSDRPGTTTDPVQKAMELLPLGPVVMTDTPGFDDDEQEPRASCASARRPERASRRSKTASARSRQKKTAGSCWQTSSARTRWSYWSRRLTNLRRRGA